MKNIDSVFVTLVLSSHDGAKNIPSHEHLKKSYLGSLDFETTKPGNSTRFSMNHYSFCIHGKLESVQFYWTIILFLLGLFIH